MAQPALSQAIQVLESELGVELFTRTTRRVDLTPAGVLLVPEARRLVDHAAAIERLMADHAAGTTGLLRIGFVDSASYEVMPRLLQAHRERHPDVRFELHTMSSDEQWAELRAGSLDLGIARTGRGQPDLDASLILQERMYVAVSTGHRLAGRQTTSLAQLAGESFIGFDRTVSPALTDVHRSMMAAAGITWDPILEAEEYTTILGLVAAGEGIAVVPASVRSFRPPNLSFVELRDAIARTELLLLSRTDESLTVVAQARRLAADLFTG